jgi:hypothetical protein
MTNFVEKLSLAERAKEDVYFSRIDRELIEALHQHEQLHDLDDSADDQQQPDTVAEQIAASRTRKQADK